MRRKYAMMLKTRKFLLEQLRHKITTLEQLRHELCESRSAIDQILLNQDGENPRHEDRQDQAETLTVKAAIKQRDNIHKSIARIDQSLEDEKTAFEDAFRSFKETETLASIPPGKRSTRKNKSTAAKSNTPYTDSYAAAGHLWYQNT